MNSFRGLIKNETPSTTKTFATVTSLSPLTLLLDIDDDPVVVEPIILVPDLRVNDRVRVEFSGASRTSLIITGRVESKPTSGTITTLPTFTWSEDFAPVYVASVTIPTPYAPPPGYGFEVFLLEANTFASASTAGQSASTITVRLQQTGNLSTDGITKLGWRLTKL